jgi:photosystem II stability/assembly factor-like uncharacterized protein
MRGPLAICRDRGRGRRRAVVLVAAASAALAWALPGRAAHANGAFPESLQIVLPAAHPRQIVLSTNFGLIISDDDGATWNWTCEQPEIISASFYAVGAPPLDRFFSLSPLMGLAHSDDSSCTWAASRGSLDRVITSDFFPSATDPMRVLAVAAPPDPMLPAQIFPSDDGGATFADAIFTAPMGSGLTGVEIARSDPKTIYLAMFTTPGLHPKLVRSTDGGGNWTTVDVEAFLGANNFRIVAVDPVDPKVLTVRVIEPLGETLAISRDGGATFTKAFNVSGGVLTSYVRLPSGTVLVGGIVLTTAVGYRSTDGGSTFQDWPGVPHLRALAARGGKVYAAAKNYTDGWAIGVSTDEGATFRPLARYDQVSAIRACVQAVCMDSCGGQVSRSIWEKRVCLPDDGGLDGGGPDAVGPPPPNSGCGCVAGGGTPGARGRALGPSAALGLLAAACAGARARRRR